MDNQKTQHSYNPHDYRHNKHLAPFESEITISIKDNVCISSVRSIFSLYYDIGDVDAVAIAKELNAIDRAIKGPNRNNNLTKPDKYKVADKYKQLGDHASWLYVMCWIVNQ